MEAIVVFDVLPRVRVFWRRVLRGILPDYATLTGQHVRVESTCPVCKSSSETLLRECAHGRPFWAAAKNLLTGCIQPRGLLIICVMISLIRVAGV